MGVIGRYHLESALQSAHVYRRRTGIGNWEAVVQIYDVLAQQTNSPVVAINRALVIAELQGAAVAIAALDVVASDVRVVEHQHYWEARAELLSKSYEIAEAWAAYDMAIGLECIPAVSRFLQKRQLTTRQPS